MHVVLNKTYTHIRTRIHPTAFSDVLISITSQLRAKMAADRKKMMAGKPAAASADQPLVATSSNIIDIVVVEPAVTPLAADVIVAKPAVAIIADDVIVTKTAPSSPPLPAKRTAQLLEYVSNKDAHTRTPTRARIATRTPTRTRTFTYIHTHTQTLTLTHMPLSISRCNI